MASQEHASYSGIITDIRAGIHKGGLFQIRGFDISVIHHVHKLMSNNDHAQGQDTHYFILY